MFVYVSVYVYMCRHVLFHVCLYVHILNLYVLYDYVQRCEGTVSVNLRFVN